ncbi:hypothetical protein CAPTEDRAFT_211595 [Capitella teleta]|uniref:F5/8 type C domain-containing protein n=1 Tax=Capitella teleta TaxID=283909 RepID=R7T5Q7_CAPTE|nr:hypothetical protein CAPTEDRAFT_211595 [Capitella teleta]|eukprot:ELT88518.1 hypothetical protein CAPTEDRAFT_211595 [Capitella teleta]
MAPIAFTKRRPKRRRWHLDTSYAEMDTAALTTAVIVYLVLRYAVAPSSATCQCDGFEPVICDLDAAQFSASSIMKASHPPVSSKRTGATWWPSNSTQSLTKSWIEVDLMTNRLIGGVATWGAYSDNHYVGSYSIKYRPDGSDIWIDHTDTDGNVTVILDNQSVVDLYPGPFSASYDGSTTGCIKTTDTVHNQIRMQWKGFVINYNVTNLVVRGKFLICSHYFTTVGIEVRSDGCNAEYALCKIEASGVDGTCHAVCGLKDGQVGQPLNLMLMVTGDGAELCDVSMGASVLPVESCVVSPSRFPAGRNIFGVYSISGSAPWDEFVQEISAH